MRRAHYIAQSMEIHTPVNVFAYHSISNRTLQSI
jgi:hypothetical protein